jgi:hypothetical protein
MASVFAERSLRRKKNSQKLEDFRCILYFTYKSLNLAPHLHPGIDFVSIELGFSKTLTENKGSSSPVSVQAGELQLDTSKPICHPG